VNKAAQSSITATTPPQKRSPTVHRGKRPKRIRENTGKRKNEEVVWKIHMHYYVLHIVSITQKQHLYNQF
jgi:hypothetical protein